MLAVALCLPMQAQAQSCSAYAGQAFINEVRVASSGKTSVFNQIEIYNLADLPSSVWSTWRVVIHYQQSGKPAVQRHNFRLTTGISANGRYIFNSNLALFLSARNNRATDIALLDASGAFIDYVALDARIQTVPACLGTPVVVDSTSNGSNAGRTGRTTDGGSWPGAMAYTSVHNIGATNNCSSPGNDVVVTSSVDPTAPIVGTTTTTYTITASNKNCSGSISGIVVSASGISASNFTSLNSSATAGTLAQGASALTWTVGTLAAGAGATLTVTGKPSKLGSLTTTASRTAPTTGLVNTVDDSASSTIVVSDKNYVGFSLLTGTVTEGTDTSYTATISSNLVASKPITINYSVSGTANSSDTNLPVSGSVTIDPASTDAPMDADITFTIQNDAVAEADKTIRLTITSVTSADAQVALDPALAILDITLIDDDHAAGPHHLELQHASGQGLTCRADSVTVVACADAACSSRYTGGISGTLSATGGSVNWPATAAFNIASGSSSTTVSVHVTTTTATVLGVAGSSPAASNAASCNFGSPVCTFTAADAGFLFNVPHHRSEAMQTVTVSAVRKSDNSPVCTPAFANVSRSVTFRCSYANPATGSLPVRVGGAALNAGNNAAAACDTGGRAVSLSFNASGVASTSVQYADAGQMALTASYSGSAGTGETGLVMSGSASFIAAPEVLGFSAVTAGPIRAGGAFAATVTARNTNNAVTPNFGRESSAETLYAGFSRIQPTGSGAVNGSFSGSFGAFSGGAASSSNLRWTEVGRGDLVARSVNNAGYLGSGLLVYGASAGTLVRCANEGQSCVLPTGATATVYYGERDQWFAKAGQSGTVACTTANFGDPLAGVAKTCHYVVTSSTGSVGDFIPNHFTVAASNACGSFSYAGQPVSTTVTARNAAGNVTLNFNGTASTTPAFAQAVTLSDANGLGLGTLSGQSLLASSFNAGVASAAPSYAFTSKTTAPQSLVLRATNGASGSGMISSQGYAEPVLALRSGRLRLSNAFGTAGAALQLAAVTEYWNGSAWLLNSADSCTAVAAASVALSNARGAAGTASAATTSAGALAISGGNGTLTLAAPTPAGSSLSLDVALNLGSTAADQSCHAAHPATTGANLAWLRSFNGSCAATADRDPAARASFGIFAPETRKTVHVRDLY